MPVESRTKGTMILRSGGRFYKVLKLKSTGNNNLIFECKVLDTKESKVLHYQMLGLIEAADCAFKEMKSKKDIFFLDLDNNGEWKVVSKRQMEQL